MRLTIYIRLQLALFTNFYKIFTHLYAHAKGMQKNDKHFYNFVQRQVLCVLFALIFACVGCAMIANIREIKGIENSGNIDNVGLNTTSFRLEPCIAHHYVHIGGYPIGISIKADGLLVVDNCNVETSDGRKNPSRELKCGDIILSINGENISSIYRLKEIVSASKDGVFKVEYMRDKVKHSTTIHAGKDKSDGLFKLGLTLKEDVGGIGTMTFVTQEGKFASLGHHIQDAETLISDELNSGHIYDASVDSVIKGEKGKAGGLVADVNKLSKSIGDIEMNTEIGLYGEYTAQERGDLYRIAMKGEAKIGKAQVLTTINGSIPKFYDIEIVKVISQSEREQKGMVILVSDKELLDKTGGIVQGMSGSPIVQNGILIGAITHVFVQDPTRGYAVHARFMYDMAQGTSANESVDNLRLVA